MSRRLHNWIVGLLLFVPSLAYAQSANEAEAQALYEAGVSYFEKEAFDEACPKFEEALKLNPGHLRTSIALANCYDKQTKTASAWKLLMNAREQAESRADQKKLNEIDGFMADLKGRLSRIQLDMSPQLRALPNLAISRDDEPIPRDQWDESIPVEPGKHRIKASASGKETWISDEYDVPMRDVVHIPVMPHWKLEEPGKNRRIALRVLGGTGVGIGVGAFIAAAVEYDLATTANTESKKSEHCDAFNACDREGLELRSKSIKLANTATVLDVVGGVMAAAGITLLVLSVVPSKNPTRTVQTNVWMGAGSIGVRGTW